MERNYPREAIRRSLIDAGVPPAAVTEAVDLACRAADRSSAAMFETAELASSSVVRLLTLQVASGLIRANSDHLDQLTAKIGNDFGGRQIKVELDMAEATDDRLRLLIERIERLEEEKKGTADDIRDVYAEVKAVGYDAPMVREIVRLRKMKPDDRAERDMILDTYRAALGMG